jgi:hypothetical protein
MNDAQLVKLSRKLQAKSRYSMAAKISLEENQRKPPGAIPDTPEMTKKEFQVFAAECAEQKEWPDGSRGEYKCCGLTDWACRDCICPKLKKEK